MRRRALLVVLAVVPVVFLVVPLAPPSLVAVARVMVGLVVPLLLGLAEVVSASLCEGEIVGVVATPTAVEPAWQVVARMMF